MNVVKGWVKKKKRKGKRKTALDEASGAEMKYTSCNGTIMCAFLRCDP